MTFLELNSDYKYSKDVAERDYIPLYLKPFETYRQYIFIGDVESVNIELLADGEVVENFGMQYELVGSWLVLDFLITKDFHSKCLRFDINNQLTNPFICSIDDLDKTTLVTYWHSENIYGIPFYETKNKPCQIRLPLYYKGLNTTEDSEEYVTNFRLEENIGRSRVKRVFKSVWLVDGNDWLNKKLAQVSDLDYVYLDTVRHISSPFTFEEAGDNPFIISEWETQERASDVVEIGITGAMTVSNYVIDVYYNNQTAGIYCVESFWYGYYHSLGITPEDTFVNIINELDGTIETYSFDDILNCIIPIDLTDRTDAFQVNYRFYLTDAAGNRSNDAKLTIRFFYEGTRYYDENYYNQTYYG